MLDENGTQILTNIQLHQYKVCISTRLAYISIIHTVGGQLMKTFFAYVDKTENFTFIFQPGIGESDIYPGMSHSISDNFAIVLYM